MQKYKKAILQNLVFGSLIISIQHSYVYDHESFPG